MGYDDQISVVQLTHPFLPSSGTHRVEAIFERNCYIASNDRMNGGAFVGIVQGCMPRPDCDRWSDSKNELFCTLNDHGEMEYKGHDWA